MAPTIPLYCGPTPLDTPDIPEELKAYRQWVLWRGVERITQQGVLKLDKIPMNAQTLRPADTTDPQTWHTFDECLDALETALEEWERDAPDRYRGGGIGFVFTADDPYIGIDLDQCFDAATHTIAAWARGYVDRLQSYTEITPSGTGLHVLVQGSLPPQGRKKGPIEMYEQGRFFTMTGWLLHGYSLAIESRQEALETLHRQVFGTEALTQVPPHSRNGTHAPLTRSPAMTDSEVCSRISQSASGATFAALHAGDWHAYASQSEAEFAYCVRLGFWTQDPAQIDRLYRASKLLRKKWDSKRGESTYGAWTIANALAKLTEHYSPSPGYAGWGDRASDTPGASLGMPPSNWRDRLNIKKNRDVVQDVNNMSLLLEHADRWYGHLWWDEVGCKPMYGDQPIDDDMLIVFGRWMGEEKLSVTNVRMLERCVLAQCRTQRRDLIQHWLHALPQWDQIPRLTTWLTEMTGVEDNVYTQEVSRLLITSMVARGMDPGCICRYVVILEGPEEFRKSTLVEALASVTWYVVLSIGLDSKDSHMMLQGAWVAEMAELDSLSKTEETRLKAFITMRHDSYIPKYSNFRESHPRRAIFVGTTNEDHYLKGQTGNTRFLPVRITKPVEVETFLEQREQIFAEALHAWRTHPQWWAMSKQSADSAREARELRRLGNVYEQPLHDWLTHLRFMQDPPPKDALGRLVSFLPGETSWPEIAQYFLRLDTPEKWKDKGLQMQIAQALKAIGWRKIQVWRDKQKRDAWHELEVSRDMQGE